MKRRLERSPNPDKGKTSPGERETPKRHRPARARAPAHQPAGSSNNNTNNNHHPHHPLSISAHPHEPSLPAPQPKPQQKRKRAAEDDATTTTTTTNYSSSHNTLTIIPYRPDQRPTLRPPPYVSPYVKFNYVNPTGISPYAAYTNNSFYINLNTNGTGNANAPIDDPCRHSEPPLWDNPNAPGAPRSFTHFREPKTIAAHLPPLDDIEEMFAIAVQMALRNGLGPALEHFGRRCVRVATMCSGTESPLLALGLISKALQENHGMSLNIDHIFSAEIVPYKQAYIERNFHPKIIFRDVRELLGASEATTAYGNKVAIPSEVDILVAGTSCVDFSSLNRWGRALEDGGESGQTFYAFIYYIAKYRPAICILENVQNAPWHDIIALLTNNLTNANKKIQEAYEGIWKDGDKAYAAAFAKLDSKDYYIPHTRQRGYAIAIDRRRHDDADNAVQVWVQKMNDLQRQASSPAQSFLSNDDARLNHFQSSAPPARRVCVRPDWTLCFARNQNFRVVSDIGSRRPLTRWVSGGSCVGPDHWDLAYVRAQSERTWDLLDISHLRNAKRGFDDCYKSRILELSQNPDRNADAHGTGLVGCLTPAGSKFITTRGRPLTGREALRLQGIPVHKLLLTHETQRELFNLAGNAMTTTVVGTALLAALIVGHRAISMDCRPNPPDNPLSIPIGKMNSEALLPEQTLDLTKYKRCSLDELCSEASASTRLCLCEGHTLNYGRSFKKCKLCGHTACEECAGIPRHNYRVLPQIRRLEPSSFRSWLISYLPMRLQLVNLDISGMEKLYASCKSHSTPESDGDWKKYREAVEQALGEDMRFTSVTSLTHWVVRYDAPHSYLELFLGKTPYWRIFAKPERQWPNNSRLRWLLKHPFARMRLISGDDFLSGEWEFHLPVFLQCSLKIEEFGPMTDSWESHLGIPISPPAVEKVHTNLRISVARPVCQHIARSIDDVVGEYELLEDCGTASRSLHKRIKHPEGPSMYFFLDPQDVGLPHHDRFIFSQDHHRLWPGEDRDVVGSIAPEWRQGRAKAEGKADSMTAECRLYGLWEACGAMLQVFQSRPGLAYAVTRRDLSIRISPGLTLTSNSSTGTQVCSTDTITFISWRVPLLEPENICWRLGPWREVDQESEAQSLQSLLWLFQKSKDIHHFPSEWRRLLLSGELTRCQSCGPDVPSVKWQQANPNKTDMIPYEDERQADIFERALKARAKPFMTQTQLEVDGCGGFVGLLRVGINFTALAHRLLSKVPFGAGGAVQLSWRLNTAYEWPLEVKFDKFTLRDNKDGVEEDFVFVQSPSQDEVYVELGRLRKEQRQSLWWMKQQESDRAPKFFEQEVEEAYLPTLGWLAETMAKFPSQARGGVLADEVGYGKTVTTLALIDATMETASELSKKIYGEGIAVKATLIIVPMHLMAQWESQIDKFLGKDYPVVKIDNFRDFDKVDVRGIQAASIVLLNWQFLTNPAYHKRLSAFAALPECSSWTGRPYKTWLEQAVQRSDDHAKELMLCEDIEDFKRFHEERLRVASQNDNAATPFKKVSEAAIQHRENGTDLKPNDPQPVDMVSILGYLKHFGSTQEGKLLGMKCPPINLFRFHRIVIDEYTYLVDSKVHDDSRVHAISFLRAPNRWVLSGTPAMVGFEDIKFLAGLIKVNLGVDHGASVALQATSFTEIKKSPTAAEKFRSYVEMRSPQWHMRRAKHAQEFLDHFVRRNTAQIKEIQTTEILKPVVLPGIERALFMELQQQLHTQEIRLCRGSSDENDGDRVRRMNNFLQNGKPPEEALLKACFSFIGETSTHESQNSFESIINRREAEYKLVCIELKRNLRHAVWLQRQLGQLPQGTESVGSSHSWSYDSKEDRDPQGSGDFKELVEEAVKGYRFDHQDDFYRDQLSKEEMAQEQAERKKREDAAKEAAKEASRKKAAIKKTANAAAKKPGSASLSSKKSTGEIGQVQNLGPGVQESGGTPNADKPIGEPSTYNDTEIASSLESFDSRPCKIDLKDRNAIKNSEKNVMKHVWKLRSELFSRIRALRFLKSAQEFYVWQCQRGPRPTCVSCDKPAEDPSTIFLLGLCGHVACKRCLEDRQRVEGCVIDGCSSAVGSQHIHPADILGSVSLPSSSHGTKLDSIISLIKEVAKHDQVLLFVQFEPILNAVRTAFEASGISYYAIHDDRTRGVAKTIRDFQDDESEEAKQVLILNPSNVTAAGLNLVNANHVVFVSPLLSKSTHEFHESRTQCIGRARRYGQTKKVHVYDFLALNTIDVDITEDQRNKRLVQGSPKNGQEVWMLKAEEDMTDDEKAKSWGSGWKLKNFFEE